MNTKRICLLIPSLNAGGMQRVMCELGNYFSSKKDLEVHMVLYGSNPEIFYSLNDNIIIHKPIFSFNNDLRVWFTIKTIFFLRQEIKKIKPVSILSFGEYWNNLVLLALFGLKYPVFVSDRCQPDKSLGKVHNTLRKFLYPRANSVIVQTKIAKDIYHEIVSSNKLHVIGNPIREIIIDKKTEKENIVLSVGRLINSKHHNNLIRLFAKIDAPAWKLIIVGGDAVKQKNFSRLQELISELNIENKVELTGLREDVDLFYARSKIFAFTSSSEGFPNVVGEALSAGLPVISYDCIAGPADMIKDGYNGFLVPIFNDEVFQKKLQSIIDNEIYREQLASNAKNSVEKFFISSIGEKYLKVLLNE